MLSTETVVSRLLKKKYAYEKYPIKISSQNLYTLRLGLVSKHFDVLFNCYDFIELNMLLFIIEF